MHSEPTAESSNEQPADDAGRLKERLTFYESFDQLIQQNVSQSGQLLREAIALKEAATHDADDAKIRLHQEQNQDREQSRALFSTMLDEITALQGQAERLARRLTDAIEVLESQLPPGAEFPSLPNNLTGVIEAGHHVPETAGALVDEDAPDPPLAEPVAVEPDAIEPLEPAVKADVPTSRLGDAVQVEPDEPAALASGPEADQAVQRFKTDAPKASVNHHPVQQNARALELDLDHSAGEMLSPSTGDIPAPSITESLEIPADTVNDDAAEQPDAPGSFDHHQRPFVLLMHGVPRAATALSLKQYLEGLDHVQKVEPREFAAGVLRLQLRVSRNLSASDLRDWPGGNELATIHSRSGLLEIQMQ